MSKLTNILMVLAVLSVGGFLYWLSVTAEPTQSGAAAQAEREAEEAEAAALAGATPVTLDQFSENPRDYVAQRLRIDEMAVASRLGSQAFWTSLTNQQPYLVRLDTGLVAKGMSVQGGDSLLVAGTVHTMNDSVLDAWEADSVVVNESQRVEAQFATTFLEADYARVTYSPGAQEGGEGEGGGSGSGESGSGSGSGSGGGGSGSGSGSGG